MDTKKHLHTKNCQHDDHKSHHQHSHHLHAHHQHVDFNNNSKKAFLLSAMLNLIFVVIEIVFGVMSGSVSLIADAIHNLTDVIGLILSWFGFKLNESKPSQARTFGYKKVSLLVAFFNSIFLVLSLVYILYDALLRLQSENVVAENQMIIVAGVGLFVNFFSAWLFRVRNNDIHLKSAFIHLLIDGLISLAVVVGGVVIKLTKMYWIDPLLAILIVVVISRSTWSLLKESWNLAIGGVPSHIHIENIQKYFIGLEGVSQYHDLHIWSLSSQKVALMVHLKYDHNQLPTIDNQTRLLAQITSELKNKFQIDHVTVQLEFDNQLFDCQLKNGC